ncbi:MAG: tetratricopeptide repeat protein [Phycisphaerae bacterium]|nr:tetratricopeptide repeat protein [Phycisphaerae bacterium]
MTARFNLTATKLTLSVLVPILFGVACTREPTHAVTGASDSAGSAAESNRAWMTSADVCAALLQSEPAIDSADVVAESSGETAVDARAVRQFERARKRFDDQHWLDAMTALDRALEIDSANIDARLLYARAALRVGNQVVAETKIREAISLLGSRRGAQSVSAYWLLGELRAQQRNAASAISAYCKAALDAGPDSIQPEAILTHLSMGLLLNHEGYLAASAECLESYLRIVQTRTGEMSAFFELRDAMDLYRGKAAAMLGDTYTALSMYDRAVSAFDRAVAEQPGEPDYQRRRIVAMAKAGRGDDSLLAARRWNNPKAAGSTLELVREVCDIIGRPDQYDAELIELSRSAADYGTMLSIARLLIERERYGEAESVLTRAAAQREVGIDAPLLLLELLARRGDFDGAVRLILDRLVQSPTSFNRAIEWTQRDWADDFLAAARRAAGKPASPGEARLLLGRLLADRREFSAAVIELRAAVELGRTGVTTLEPLIVSLCGLKQWEAAIEVGTSVGAAEPSSTILMALGDAYAALDLAEDAEQAYLSAFEADRASGEALFRLAELAQRRGQTRRAEQLLRRIVDEVDPKHMMARERLVVQFLNRGDFDNCRGYFSDFETLGLTGPPALRCAAMIGLVNSKAATPQTRLDEYLASLRQILVEYPDDADTYVEIARSYGAVNDDASALAAVEKALEIAPEHLSARELKANYLARLLRFHEAAEVIRTLLRDRPRDLSYLQDLLRFAQSEGDWDTTAALLRDFLARKELKDERHAFTSLLISVLNQANRFDEAVDVAKAWLDEAPDDIVRRSTLLSSLGRAGRHDEAIDLARSYLQTQPDNRMTQMLLLARLQEAKRPTEALQYALSWLEKAPDDIDLNMALIRLCWTARQWDEAAELARINAERSESRTTFELLLADTYQFARRYDDVIHLYKDRISQLTRRRREVEDELAQVVADPNKQRALLVRLRETISETRQANQRLIISLLTAERYDQAERIVNSLLLPELAARDAGRDYDLNIVIEMRYHLSEICQDTGRMNQAIQQLEAIYELDPEDPGINNNLGYILIEADGDLDRAERMIRLSLAQNPKSHAALDSLGWLLYKRGIFDEAVYYLRQSIRLSDGEEPVLHDHLGDALYHKGDRAAAAAEWKIALEMCAPDHDPPPDRDRRLLHGRIVAKLRQLEIGEAVEVAPIREAVQPAAATDAASAGAKDDAPANTKTHRR